MCGWLKSCIYNICCLLSVVLRKRQSREGDCHRSIESKWHYRRLAMVKLHIFKSGSIWVAAELIKGGGGWKKIELPVLCFLLEHPLALTMFDTGFLGGRLHRLLKLFPWCLYRSMFDIEIASGDRIDKLWKDVGWSVTDVKLVVLSHFHFDHTAGLSGFPRAVFLYRKCAYERLASLRGWKACRKGYIPALLPSDFIPRSRYFEGAVKVRLEPEYAPFDYAWDVFEDRTVLAVPLPGHAAGHVGLFINTEDTVYFLVGDACFTCDTFTELCFPPDWVLHFLCLDRRKYIDTISKINLLHKNRPDIQILPSHCPKALEHNSA